jgi:sugar lactone lactonase YvrE
MTTRIVTLALALALGAAFGQVPEDRTSYEVPGDATFPEGIAALESGEAFFVTGAGSGGIYRIDVATGEATTLLEPGSRPGFHTIGLALDAEGRLWVAGGESGEILRFDDLDTSQAGFDASAGPSAVFPTPGVGPKFINDVAVGPNGDVYATDSVSPTLYRVTAAGTVAEAFIDFTDTEFEYLDGFNANGLAVTADGAYVIVVAANSGRLFRVDVANASVATITSEEVFVGGDGLVLDGQTLYVVQNGLDQISVVNLSEDWLEATVDRVIQDDRLSSAATAALVGDRLLVVNAQFAAMEAGPELPFTVSVLPAR